MNHLTTSFQYHYTNIMKNAQATSTLLFIQYLLIIQDSQRISLYQLLFTETYRMLQSKYYLQSHPSLILFYINIQSIIMTQLRLSKQSHPQKEHTCDICYVHYNKSTRVPLIICPHQHQTCSYCIRAIRKNKKCPFCRQPLNFDLIKINKQIMKKLQDDPNQPNLRHLKTEQSYYQLTPQSSSIASQQDYNEGLLLQLQQDWQRNQFQVRLQTERKRKLLYVGTALFVLPFFILDFYYAFFYHNQPTCTDQRKLFGLMNFRLWMLIISISEGTYLVIFIISVIKNRCGRQFDLLYLNLLEEIYMFGIALKSALCCVVELFIFFGVVMTNCSGPVYGYGVVLCCIHILKLTIVSLGLIKNWCC